jgi:hypothetical protein
LRRSANRRLTVNSRFGSILNSFGVTGTVRDFKRWSAEKNGANHML